MAGTLPSGTAFPGAIDGVANGFGQVAAGQVITAAYANDQTSAILALENVVGASPLAGTGYSTIGAALQGSSGNGGVGGNIFLASNFT